MSKSKNLAVKNIQPETKMNKDQLKFHKLIKQIESKRALLLEWEAAIPLYQQKYTSDLLPLIDSLIEIQIKLLNSLDQVIIKKGITKAERVMIADIIVDVAGQVLSRRDNAELKALYNKYSDLDYESEVAADLDDMKAMMEVMLGVDLGDEQISPEALLKRLQELEQQPMPRPKKSAKQQAKQAALQAEEQQVSLSIREVYKKLASALHPDREPDALERERKTALMQRVNQAYEKRNLLQLLELQLELEQIDQIAVNNISADRLKHYLIVLKEQLSELEQEIMHVEMRFAAQFNLDPFDRISPSALMRRLNFSVAEIKVVIAEAEKDLLVFEDHKLFKSWLKNMKSQQSYDRDNFDDCPF